MTRGNRDEFHPNRQVGPETRNRLDDRYSTLGEFTAKSGRVEDRAISMNTYNSAILRRSITADPIRRRKTMRQMSSGELEGR